RSSSSRRSSGPPSARSSATSAAACSRISRSTRSCSRSESPLRSPSVPKCGGGRGRGRDVQRFDRSFQTDARAEPARPGGGAASGALANMNRLAEETSPYLLQHADNPVDWFPWGDDARERARGEDKPILLSVGYAACHWCHVMEHES